MLIDRYLPPSDSVVFHAAVITAGVERTYTALRRFDFFQVPLVRLPNLMRLWPERLWRRLRGRAPLPPAPQRVMLEDLLAMKSFDVLAEEPGRELVLGSVGRFWTRDFGRVPFTRETFATLAPPDCGKIGWSLRVEPYGEHRSLVIVDVRVSTTDAAAHAHFRRYWRGVGTAVRWMTRSSIARVKKALERTVVPQEVSGPALLLERQLPAFDKVQLFLRRVTADAARTYDAARRVDQLMSQDPVNRVFGAVRDAPRRLAARLGLRASRRAVPESATTPFLLLDERPGEEYVVGLIGRFWEAGVGLVPFTPKGFKAFHTPGYAKVALNYAVRALSPGTTLLISEIRTALTDAEALRHFNRRYWWWLAPFAYGVMRRPLTLIQRAAEFWPTRRLWPARALLPARAPVLFSRPIERLTPLV